MKKDKGPGNRGALYALLIFVLFYAVSTLIAYMKLKGR